MEIGYWLDKDILKVPGDNGRDMSTHTHPRFPLVIAHAASWVSNYSQWPINLRWIVLRKNLRACCLFPCAKKVHLINRWHNGQWRIMFFWVKYVFRGQNCTVCLKYVWSLHSCMGHTLYEERKVRVTAERFINALTIIFQMFQVLFREQGTGPMWNLIVSKHDQMHSPRHHACFINCFHAVI